jgi:hypothetical protein
VQAVGTADGSAQCLAGLVLCEDGLGKARLRTLVRNAGLDDRSTEELLKQIDNSRQQMAAQGS